jgi:hypothetical protein
MRILAAVNRKLAEWKGLLRRQQRSRCRQPHRKRWQGTRLQQPCYSAKRQWSGSAKHNCISALEPQDSVRVLQHGGLRSSTPGYGWNHPAQLDLRTSLPRLRPLYLQELPRHGTCHHPVRTEAFNISNTPNFFIGNNNISNQEFGQAAFGSISATDPNYNPRQYQFVLKVLF